MTTQVARIGGQLLQADLLRELDDLKFDNDLLVVKRDNTLGINTTTTPRNLTVTGTMRTASGSSADDIIFGNSLKVGDFTIATTGISTGVGDVTLKSTHPQGYIRTNGIGSYNFAVRDDGLVALGTNDSVGLKSEVVDGQTLAWNSNGNYGDYWYPGPINSATSVPNDATRLYDEANNIRLRGAPFTAQELEIFDWDQDGDVQADDVLNIGNLNTSYGGGQAFPASKTLADHPNTDALKAYIEANYPRSAPRKLQLQTGNTLTVTGNIHASGNITYGGTSLTIGDDSTDTATFSADFHDDLVPDQDGVFHIGKDNDSTGPQKAFKMAVAELKADSVFTGGIIYRGIELTKDVGLIYVANNNGNDTNTGRNPGGPFATITKALSVAQDGDLIYVYPGTYQEAFPLTVPKGVTIQGDNLRGVELMPTSGTQSNDAFLLNSDSTIENITIKDFYYNSSNDTGYAFKFASNFLTSPGGRSPYVRNVTVITKGSTTSQADPRGYDAGDAGKGALVDGSVVDQASISASMLFHSVTFITPGVDALTIKNGVRVEWLNSFSYFANSNINVSQGSVGRLLADSTRQYGAEVRCIASAAVYGNKGIIADGADCLVYAINHNFAYVGSGKDVTNDNTLSIQANEVVETNNAKIYFTSQDQRGNFRVGDKFLVDLENERTSFDVESIFADNTKVDIRQGNDVVSLEPGKITLSNIAIQGNNIETTVSNIDFNSVDNIVFQGDVVAPNVTTTGNFVIDGTINTLGDSAGDTVDFNTPISQAFVPGNDNGTLILRGNKDDPSFAYGKTYTLTANGITYTYGPTGDGTGGNNDARDGNHYLGIADLNVPGLTYGVSAPGGGLTNPVQITYVSQAPGDRLVLANTNGWTHVGLTAGGSYKADGTLLGTSTKTWANLYGTTANIDTVYISSQNIGTNTSDADLRITATGTGKVFFDNLELFSNKIVGKFSPEGEFTVGVSTRPGYPSVFTGYLELREHLPKYTTVLGIPVLGTALASEVAVKHAANLLGSYLDNDYDGVADNSTIYAEFSDGMTAVVVYADSTDEANLTSTLGSFKPNRTFSVLESEMNNYNADGASNQRNLVQEKLLKDLIIPKYCSNYTELSIVRQSTLTDAMDAARGGFEAGGDASYNYPPFAWYTSTQGLSYENLVYEYLYLLITSEAGTNDWRASTITDLFDHYNSLLLSTNDVAGYNIVTGATYNFPTTTPSLDYWTSVTNVLGGTSRDITLSPTDSLDIDSTGNIRIAKGTSAQRPTVKGGLRYNNDFGTFEGTETAGSVSLSGLYDTDRDTYLDMSNNQINFVTDSVTNHTLNGTLIESGGFSSNHKFSIDGNVVSSDDTTINNNSILRSNGTGYTVIENGAIRFQDSILNNNTNTNFKFTLTNTNNTAYLKIDNTSGMVVPFGNTSQRPSIPELGHTRYNTQLELVETWNGSAWINAAGEVESIAVADVEELAYVYNLILD